ncbi:hypothetical protein DFH27DRAFT_59973 [Peziza echinospora]|nr:hypothetical protein DFH27DRAFT_59973 [Peziza echinospora]
MPLGVGCTAKARLHWWLATSFCGFAGAEGGQTVSTAVVDSFWVFDLHTPTGTHFSKSALRNQYSGFGLLVGSLTRETVGNYWVFKRVFTLNDCPSLENTGQQLNFGSTNQSIFTADSFHSFPLFAGFGLLGVVRLYSLALVRKAFAGTWFNSVTAPRQCSLSVYFWRNSRFLGSIDCLLPYFLKEPIFQPDLMVFLGSLASSIQDSLF